MHPTIHEKAPNQPRPIAGQPTSFAALIGRFEKGPLDRPVALASAIDLSTQFGDGSSDAAVVRSFFDNGGKRMLVARTVCASADALAGSVEDATGLLALDHSAAKGRFQLLILPATADLDPAGAARVIEAAARFCNLRRVFLIADPPAAISSASAVLVWAQPLDLGDAAANVALYFPSIERAIAAGSTRTLAASGAVAGLYARSDEQRGVWKAPAGSAAAIAGAAGVTFNTTRAEIAALAAGGVNPIRELVAAGIVVWGARTLATDSEWRYVSVRRTALYVEDSLRRGLEWVVFEPNDEPLWGKVRRAVDEFLFRHFLAGALAGSTPRDAYFVRVGRTTMTQDDVDRGLLIVEIGFAPLRPAEFVILRLAFASAVDV